MFAPMLANAIIEFFKNIGAQGLNGALTTFVSEYHVLTYGLLALIIFCETGLVVTPFLPGDSLLFAAGAVIGLNPAGPLTIWLLIPILIGAALLGDHTNYFMGRFIARKGKGAKLFGLFTIREDYLKKTEAFFERYGGRTIIMARFVPIVRTFAPFVAGVGEMPYRRYVTFCLIGATLWVPALTVAGYYFGRIEWVSKHFELVVFAIIGISLLPVAIEFIRHRLSKTSK